MCETLRMATTVAQAAPPYQHMRYSGSDSFTNTICGLDVTIDTEFHGVFTIRTVKDSGGQAFLATTTMSRSTRSPTRTPGNN